MDVLYERVAGLEHRKEIGHGVRAHPRPEGPPDRGHPHVPHDDAVVGVMADLLAESGVTLAGMESTSTYWKPLFYCLEQQMECWLINAAHIKALPGRKTDVRDAKWIAMLLEHGLVGGPRSYPRHRSAGCGR